MRGTQGALIVASTLQIVLGFSGLWRNVVRFLNMSYLNHLIILLFLTFYFNIVTNLVLVNLVLKIVFQNNLVLVNLVLKIVF